MSKACVEPQSVAGGGGLTSVYLEKEGGAEEFLLCNLRSVFYTTITTFSGVKYLRVGGPNKNQAESGRQWNTQNPSQPNPVYKQMDTL